MEQIIDCLVRAGYYRARISTLSDFDKIIGGIAWAMQLFSYDINIDVFYTDTLDLGQKINLTERLVMVLLAVKCPYRLEPHQIVGLDFESLFPVIVWLIKRSEEIRREHEAFNRLLALRHYHRVTNTTPNRSEWCHLIRADLRVQPGDSHDAATSSTLELIDELYKDNERVSFVKLANVIRASREAAAATTTCSTQQEHDPTGLDVVPPLGQVATGNKQQPAEETTCFTDDDAQTTISNESSSQETKLPASIARLEISNEEEPHEGERSPGELNSMSNEEIEQHKKLDLELLATNQKILNLLKKLDMMPSQLEISQYQTRYVELSQQMISTNRSVKKLFDLYNNLDVTRHYLEKELNLLESIADNLNLSNNSSSNRESFMKQLNNIVVKILSICDDMAAKVVSLRQRRNTLNDEYDLLLRELTGGQDVPRQT